MSEPMLLSIGEPSKSVVTVDAHTLSASIQTLPFWYGNHKRMWQRDGDLVLRLPLQDGHSGVLPACDVAGYALL